MGARAIYAGQAADAVVRYSTETEEVVPDYAFVIAAAQGRFARCGQGSLTGHEETVARVASNDSSSANAVMWTAQLLRRQRGRLQSLATSDR
jgi:hypothetical protein